MGLRVDGGKENIGITSLPRASRCVFVVVVMKRGMMDDRGRLERDATSKAVY